MWNGVEAQRRACPEAPMAIGGDYRDASGGPGLAWFVGEAVRAGYITEAGAIDLLGPSVTVARRALKAIWDVATDPALEPERRRVAATRQVADRVMTPAQRAATRSDDPSTRFDVWWEIIAHPEVVAHGRSSPLTSPDWSVDWPEGTPRDRTGSGQWRVVAAEVARRRMAATAPESPVWFVGRDLVTDCLERVTRGTGTETVGPLDPDDRRVRSIPPTVRLVVGNSLAARDDAWAWLRPLLDRDATLGRRTLLLSAYEQSHFGSFFEETGVRLLRVGHALDEYEVVLARLAPASSATT
jgi:hypothetical protein